MQLFKHLSIIALLLSSVCATAQTQFDIELVPVCWDNDGNPKTIYSVQYYVLGNQELPFFLGYRDAVGEVVEPIESDITHAPCFERQMLPEKECWWAYDTTEVCIYAGSFSFAPNNQASTWLFDLWTERGRINLDYPYQTSTSGRERLRSDLEQYFDERSLAYDSINIKDSVHDVDYIGWELTFYGSELQIDSASVGNGNTLTLMESRCREFSEKQYYDVYRWQDAEVAVVLDEVSEVVEFPVDGIKIECCEICTAPQDNNQNTESTTQCVVQDLQGHELLSTGDSSSFPAQTVHSLVVVVTEGICDVSINGVSLPYKSGMSAEFTASDCQYLNRDFEISVTSGEAYILVIE